MTVTQSQRLFRLPGDVRMYAYRAVPSSRLVVTHPKASLTFDELPDSILERLLCLADEPKPFDALIRSDDAVKALLSVRLVLANLSERMWLEELLFGVTGEIMAIAHKPQVGIRLGSLAPGQLSRLREHSFLHTEKGKWLLANPETSTVIEIISPTMFDYCMKGSSTDLEFDRLSTSERSIHMFLGDHGFLAREASQSRAEICWEFHDALFHGVTTAGRTSIRGYGATYPYLSLTEQAPPPCFLETPDEDTEVVELSQTLSTSPQAEVLSAILANRRSSRSFQFEPITRDQLANLLHLALRARSIASNGADVDLFHPYSSGGARGEITTIIAIDRCIGLQPGLYAYLSVSHQLYCISQSPTSSRTVIAILAARTGKHPVLPAAALLFVADYKRMAWKYEAICYSTILRNVGCIYQSVGTAAAALGLGVCAIGGGWGQLSVSDLSSDLVGRVIVGGMVLGIPELS